MPDKTQGIIDKFKVWRNHDPTHRHDDCRYFVLDPQHDILALAALSFYGQLARQAGFTPLADDITAWVREVEDATP